MEKSGRDLEKSIMDMLQLDGNNELHDPIMSTLSHVIYNSEHEFVIRIQ